MNPRWHVAPRREYSRRYNSGAPHVQATALLVLLVAHSSYTSKLAPSWKIDGSGSGVSSSGNKTNDVDAYDEIDNVKTMQIKIQRATMENPEDLAAAMELFQDRYQNSSNDTPPKFVLNESHPPKYLKAIDGDYKLDFRRPDLATHRAWRKKESADLSAFPPHTIFKAKQRQSKRFKEGNVHHGDQKNRLLLCPKNSHDATHAECVCRPGHVCSGKRCYKTNRGQAFRIIGSSRCDDCRCDITACEGHRSECSKYPSQPFFLYPHIYFSLALVRQEIDLVSVVLKKYASFSPLQLYI